MEVQGLRVEGWSASLQQAGSSKGGFEVSGSRLQDMSLWIPPPWTWIMGVVCRVLRHSPHSSHYLQASILPPPQSLLFEPPFNFKLCPQMCVPTHSQTQTRIPKLCDPSALMVALMVAYTLHANALLLNRQSSLVTNTHMEPNTVHSILPDLPCWLMLNHNQHPRLYILSNFPEPNSQEPTVNSPLTTADLAIVQTLSHNTDHLHLHALPA